VSTNCITYSWEDFIKMDLQEIRWKGVDWIDLAQDRDRWWAVVIVVLTFVFHRMWGIFLMR
jgi:hypothetical protein